MSEQELANQSRETETETQEQTEQQTENTTQEAPQTLRVKYNSEEKELSFEEATILAQKGMNYEKAITKAETEARDKVFAELYGESHGITTYAQYQEALKEQEIRAQYANKELPDEVVNELVENRKFREQHQTAEKEREQQQWEQKEYDAFLKAYPEVKGEDIPVEVWAEFNAGKSLVDAYAKHENAILKAKLAEYEKGKQTEEANQANAAASPGSVAGQGQTVEGAISFETFEANKDNQSWVKKNLEKIMESRANW